MQRLNYKEGTEMTERQKRKFLGLLWDSLKRDPEYYGTRFEDRRQTGWGTKTQVGLLACIERIIEEG